MITVVLGLPVKGMKIFPLLLLLLLTCLGVSAQTVQFKNLNPRQFSGNGYVVSLTNGVPVTNAVMHQVTKFAIAGTTNVGAIYTGSFSNTFMVGGGSTWDTNSFDYGMLIGVNPAGFFGHDTNWPSYHEGIEDYYVTQAGIPQVEYYHVYSNPRVPFNNRPFSITPHLDNNTIESDFNVTFLTLGTTTGTRRYRFYTGEGAGFNNYFDGDNLFVQSVGAGAAAFLSANGTNASITAALNGAGGAVLDSAGFRITHTAGLTATKLISNGTNTFNGTTSVAPGNTVTPAGWLAITNGNVRYYLPLFQ